VSPSSRTRGIEASDRTQEIRAMNILSNARSPPKALGLITQLGAQMMENELAAQAANATQERDKQKKLDQANENKMVY